MVGHTWWLWSQQSGAVAAGPLPPPAVRTIKGAVLASMQGLIVETAQYGLLPWWDAALFCLTAEDRRRVYQAKRTNGDTHGIISYTSRSGSLYDESGNPYQAMREQNFVNRPDEFQAAVIEVIREGFVPAIFMDENGGWSGSPQSTQELPALVAALQTTPEGDLTDHVVVLPGWDGVFYGHSPDEIVAWGALARSLAPHMTIGIEMSSGHIPLGEGPSDWTPTGRMKDFDALLVEFNFHPDDTYWQIGARLLGAAYVRPPDQPPHDDPPPVPWYLKEGSARGPVVVTAFEYFTYLWVRADISAAACVQRAAYLRDMGWPFVTC